MLVRAAIRHLHAVVRHERFVYSFGALVAAVVALVVVTGGFAQPARAIGVLAFLIVAPWMLAGRLIHALPALEAAVVGLASSVAVSGIMAGVTLAVGTPAPRTAVIVFAAATGVGTLADLARGWKRVPVMQ